MLKLTLYFKVEWLLDVPSVLAYINYTLSTGCVFCVALTAITSLNNISLLIFATEI
jgi:hypothetical protein